MANSRVFGRGMIAISQVLNGLELLFLKTQLWEDVASKEVSLLEHLTVVKSLIRRWRRIELDSWPSVMRAKEVKMKKEALKVRQRR